MLINPIKPIPNNRFLRIFHIFAVPVQIFSSFPNCWKQRKNSPNRITIWKSILLSYNSRAHHLLIQNKTLVTTTIRIINILHKKNIFHKSSEDDMAVCSIFGIEETANQI